MGHEIGRLTGVATVLWTGPLLIWLAVLRLQMQPAFDSSGTNAGGDCYSIGRRRRFLFGLHKVGIDFHFQLSFDRSVARCHEGVVVTVVGSAHALNHPPLVKQTAILAAQASLAMLLEVGAVVLERRNGGSHRSVGSRTNGA